MHTFTEMKHDFQFIFLYNYNLLYIMQMKWVLFIPLISSDYYGFAPNSAMI